MRWMHPSSRSVILAALCFVVVVCAALPALAQGTTDYKALVCIFMFGGNDCNNMLVPTDSRYSAYLQARSVLALPQSQLTENERETPVHAPSQAATAAEGKTGRARASQESPRIGSMWKVGLSHAGLSKKKPSTVTPERRSKLTCFTSLTGVFFSLSGHVR